MVARVHSLMDGRAAAGDAGGAGGAAPGAAALFGPMSQAIMGLSELAGLGAAADGGVAGGGGVGATTGDAVSDEELPALLSRLMEEFGGASGAPPASEEAIKALKTFEVSSLDDLPREVALQVGGAIGQTVTIPADFGPSVDTSGIDARLIPVDPPLVNGEITNAAKLHGRIAVVKRGKVDFATKARRVQAAGARAVIVVQDRAVWPYTMQDSKTKGEGVDIPVVMIEQEHGERLLSLLAHAEAEDAASDAAGVEKTEPATVAAGAAAAGVTSAGGDAVAEQLRSYRKRQAAAHAAKRAAAEGKGVEDMSEEEALARSRGVWGKLLSQASNTTCVVCQCEYESGDTAVQMPCQHLYHRDCLLEWLKSHNSCCICRLELKTDDPDYEARKRRKEDEEAGTAQWASWFS